MKVRTIEYIHTFGKNIWSKENTNCAKAILTASDEYDIVILLTQLGCSFEDIINLVADIYEIGYCCEDRNLQLASALAYANWVGNITIEQIENISNKGEVHD